MTLNITFQIVYLWQIAIEKVGKMKANAIFGTRHKVAKSAIDSNRKVHQIKAKTIFLTLKIKKVPTYRIHGRQQLECKISYKGKRYIRYWRQISN